jgi:hypothetical protein
MQVTVSTPETKHIDAGDEKTISITFKGTTVTLMERDPEMAELKGTNALLVYIDTPVDADEYPLVVRINDDDTFEGVIR